MDSKLGVILVSFQILVAAPHPLLPALWQAAAHVFLEQLVESLQEVGWAERTQFSVHQESVFCSLTAASNHRDADREVGGPLLQAPHPTAEVKRLFNFLFLFYPFCSQRRKSRALKSSFIYGEN